MPHDHAHISVESRTEAPATDSVLAMGAGRRAALALLPICLLWLGVWWALSAGGAE